MPSEDFILTAALTFWLARFLVVFDKLVEAFINARH